MMVQVTFQNPVMGFYNPIPWKLDNACLGRIWNAIGQTLHNRLQISQSHGFCIALLRQCI